MSGMIPFGLYVSQSKLLLPLMVLVHALDVGGGFLCFSFSVCSDLVVYEVVVQIRL